MEGKMTLEDFYLIAEIGAAFAVVGSLLFVGIQLRQNTYAMQISNAQAGITSWNAQALVVVENEDFAQAMSDDTFPELMATQSDVVGLRLMFWSQAALRTVETLYLQWRAGNLSDELWMGYRAGITRSFTFLRTYNDTWALYRTSVSADFRSYVDGLQKEAEDLRATMSTGN
jgi:hypothetical protein